MNNNLPTLELNLSEENEIGFKLKIEGSDKEIGSSKPNIRFLLSEEETGKGWIFSTDKTEDGVSITIPPMKGLISENKNYSGKLEIILAGRYFTPTEVNIDFIEPIKVEAAFSVIKKNGSTSNKILEEDNSTKKVLNASSEPEFSIESEIDSIITKPSNKTNNTSIPIETSISTQIPFKTLNEDRDLVNPMDSTESKKPKEYSELSSEQKETVNKLFLEKCNKLGISPKEVKSLMKEGTSYTKKRLTALLAQATKEFINSL
jgi:hypothetical protein